ncbi:uncharacterized protein STEHIDRAFT_75460 [Stereum hirsutum FP-91666 SS1]|uniref:uncharacterized protein n=1 Tax=Stereum hirsutum (strain FP-91666) TaxID=721885 RepID=UPI000440B2A4|nr:uncharacterized protein STEHIDRAFT_75460 [Stereum hirsutum FP-91666 SS1]EIM88717.1 hypothetical protein STEHIDRAFT_75460 [Stereum hirsutum FP-91666 SS1]
MSPLTGTYRLWRALGVTENFDPACKLVTSPLFSPLVLAGFRLLIALYTLITLCITVAFASEDGAGDSYFSYFTHLSYIGLCSWFWASGIQTLIFGIRAGSGNRAYPLQTWPRILQFLHMLLFSTIIVYPIITTAVFWSLLTSSTTLSGTVNAWTNISVHALNTALAAFEIFLTNMPPTPYLHVVFLVILLAFYLGVAYITFATQGFYVYDFLDPSEQGALLAAYIVGIGAGCVVVFLVTRNLCLARQKIVARFLPQSQPATAEVMEVKALRRPYRTENV